MKKFAAIVLALTLVLTCCAALAEGTYVHTFTAEELAGTTDMNGFVSALALTERNTLVLKDDGTYEYTKLMAYIDENGEVMEVSNENGTMRFEIRYTYTGTYTQNGDQVTLNIPDECVFSEDWGVLVAGGYMKNSEGKASEGARVTNYEGTDFDPMDNFDSQVYKFVGHDAPLNVTVNADGTFTYNAVSSSDDD